MISSLFNHLLLSKAWALDDSPHYWENVVSDPRIFATWHEVEMCINNPQMFDMSLVDRVTNQYIELPIHRQAWTKQPSYDSKDIADAFADGNTLIINNFDWVSKEKQQILEVIEDTFFDITSALHVYCGLGPSKSFQIHEDNANNFIIQVEGKTHWQVFKQRASYMVQKYEEGVNIEDLDIAIDVELKPGDILYIPARCWHIAKPQEKRLSVSVPMAVGVSHLKRKDRKYYAIT